jgi:electron transfer flavoprotein beta subunit
LKIVNIVVAMKQIPDLQQIRIRNREPVLDAVPLTLGNIDKNALEAAVAFKESHGGKVTVLSAGSEDLEDTIKEALAAGADEAFLVLDDELDGADSEAIAGILGAALNRIEDKDLIIFGEGSGDNYSGQVGPRVAEILGIPLVTYASSIEINDKTAKVVRSLEDCEEIIELTLPAAVSVLAGINEPRIPSVTQILKAGKKPKEILEMDDLGLALAEKQVITLSNLAPESERKQILLKSADELVKALSSQSLIGR